MQNGATGDNLAITGNLSGTTDINVDANLGTASTDTVTLGGSASGTINLHYNVPGGVATLGTPLVVVKGSNLNSATFTETGLPSAGALISVSQQTTPDAVQIITQANPTIGGIANRLSLVDSLIGTIINRRSSVFASTPVYSTKHFGAPGGWARVVGGRAKATATSYNGVSNLPATITANYAGIQAGGDWGYCISDSGWDIVCGANFGANRGTTKQNVYAVDPTDPTKLTSTITSVTSSCFNQQFGGFYLVATKRRMSFNLQLRRARTSFDFTNPAFFGST